MWSRRPVDSDFSRISVIEPLPMPTRSLRQCHACRLTWFPHGEAGAAACPACGGTKVGGKLELFHAGMALIVLGAIGWFLRHGPLSQVPALPIAAPVQSTQPIASVERAIPVHASSTNFKPVSVKPTKVKPLPVKRVAVVKPGKVKTSKVKASTVKRRQKKAKTRSKHVQR